MSGEVKHHMFNPLITEEELIKEALFLYQCELDSPLTLPPNLINYPQLMDKMVNNYNSPIFEGY